MSTNITIKEQVEQDKEHLSSLDTLRHLAKDEDAPVRRAVAENPGTPPDALLSLAADDTWTIRQSVAGNPSTRSSTLAKLGEDKSHKVRQAVARNSNTSPYVLEILISDEYPSVRQEAHRQLTEHAPQAPGFSHGVKERFIYFVDVQHSITPLK